MIENKVQIKHALKVNKQLSKEQEGKKKELKDQDKSNPLQGDVIEDDSFKMTVDGVDKEEAKEGEIIDDTQIDSGDKMQDDSTKNQRLQSPKKPLVILSPEEIKDKLENHIGEIGARIESRVKLSKKMILRYLDQDMMNALTKAVKMRREKEPISTLGTFKIKM